MITHLHRHSDFSLLDGAGTAEGFAKKAADLGQEHLALTDHGSLSGILHHVRACDKHGIIPICGMEAYFRVDRTIKSEENKPYYHMVLLAANQEGWRNLMRISSESYKSGFYYKPCVDYELLEQHSEGLIVSTACMASYSSKMLLAGDEDKARSHVSWLKDTFDGRVYMEIMPNTVDDQKPLNIRIANLANSLSVPIVGTADAHFPHKDWADTQDVLVMIATNTTFEDRRRKREAGEDVYEFGEPTLYLQSQEEMEQLFKENHPDLPDEIIQEALVNTQEVVSWTDPLRFDKSNKVPSIERVSSKPARQIIEEWCEEGLERVGHADEEEYRERLDYELGVMDDMEVFDYFVIVGDLVRWAKENDIRVGVGRGSAGGCLVAYLTGITAIDPIKHELLFERFLNPERDSLPDIDLDFQHDKRDQVKEYLSEHWGESHVADIVAHSTYAPKSAIKDVSKVYGIPFEDALAVTKTMEDSSLEVLVTLADLYETNSVVREYADEHPDIWKHASRIEGMVKARGKHAAGVVITKDPLSEYMPTMRGRDGETITAWGESRGFKIISEYGFLKLDVLGIDGLTKQDTILQHIKDSGQEVPDIDNLPFLADPADADPAVVQAFGQDRTFGVFQFSSPGITGLLKHIKPTKFGDIVAANALYRPGPLEGGIAFKYGDIKNGTEDLEYWDDAVVPFMEDTYGLLVYQEQVMQLVRILAGFGKAESATVLKLITKAIQSGGREKIKKYYDRWIEGCAESGIDADTADMIWEKIVAFCGYSFNRAHACGYAAHAYQDMYLKLNYPTAFWTAMLTHEPKHIARSIREARAEGIRVLPPDINASAEKFTIDYSNSETGEIRFGLSAIKNVGHSAVQEILLHQPFESFEDFEARVTKRKCNKRVKEFLIKAGAFDRFGMRDELDAKEKTALELEVLGFALSKEGMNDSLKAKIRSYLDDFDGATDEETVQVGGEVVDYTEHKTKKKQEEMAFVELQFGSKRYSLVVFPAVFKKYKDDLHEGAVIMAQGRKDGQQLLVNAVLPVEELE